MTNAIKCDHCGTVLEVDHHGEDLNGESSAWLSVGTRDGKIDADACSRACAVELLADDTWLTEAINERYAGVAAVDRVLREDEDTEGNEDEAPDGS